MIAFAFGAGKPGGHDGTRLVEDVAEDQRPAGEEDDDDRNAGGLHVADGFDVFLGEREVAAVADAFGVGCFADHDDADGRARGAGAVLGEGDLRAFGRRRA